MYRGPCHWSKTNWALWKGAGCLCREVPKPRFEKLAERMWRIRWSIERKLARRVSHDLAE